VLILQITLAIGEGHISRLPSRLTALGYLFVLKWPQHCWPLFVAIGPTLSIVTLLWLNRTFTKYKTAKEHKYEELQQEAERTFSIIERAQRIQFVLLVRLGSISTCKNAGFRLRQVCNLGPTGFSATSRRIRNVMQARP
jgi:hypothetical protein